MCVTGQIGLNPTPVLARDKRVTVNLNVDFCVANAHIVTGLPQKKGANPNCCQMCTEIKKCERCLLCRSLEFCKFCQKCPNCCHRSTCGGKVTQIFGEVGSSGFESKKVVTTLRQGYTLPFQFRPNLTRSPTVISNYHNPSKQAHLLEALYQLVNKNAVELDFDDQLFLVPKPNNRWRPIHDLSNLNTFLNRESFKMETPETIRTSLQAGEWVTSIDFKDAYFHVPIHDQSRKYMHFTSRVSPTTSKPYPLASPQLPRSSQWWPKRSN